MRQLIAGVLLVAAVRAFGQCSAERSAVKVAADPDAGSIAALSVLPTTIAALQSLPAARPLPQNNRLAPVETSVYSVTATLLEYVREGNSDYRLVLSDETGRTIIAEIPSPPCAEGNRF